MAKQKNQLQISVSNSGFVDEGDGVVSFPGGLTITDDSVMRSGTRYDIESLDISKYQGQLTADHKDSLGTLIGKVIGTAKDSKKVTVQAIKYAVNENPYARLAYDLLVGGFSNSFSIETIGDYPDMGDPVFRDHELVGLSQVVVPNNYNATVNGLKEAVCNSLEASEKDGLDVKDIKEELLSEEQEAPEEEPKGEPEKGTPEEPEEAPAEEPEKAPAGSTENSADLNTEVSPKVDESEDSEEEPEEESEDKPEEEPKEPEEEPEETEQPEKGKENKQEEKVEMTPEELKAIVENAIQPLAEKVEAAEKLAQSAIDAQAKEPEFQEVAEEEKTENKFSSLSAEELMAKQMNAAVKAERFGNVESRQLLREINEYNLKALKEAKIVSNALTLEDLGNFVISPEMYKEIATKRTDYSALIDATDWRETASIEFAWLTRSSDIDMQNVALGAFGDVAKPDASNKRLKPVNTPGYASNTDKLEEMASVVPISLNVLKFAAADILEDASAGYRNDYDRKRAQLIVARLQQATDATNQVESFKVADGMDVWAMVVAKVSDATTVGTLVMSARTLALMKSQAIKEKNPALLQEIASGSILGTPFIVVSNDLLPALNTDETRVFKVHGTDVTVKNAVFYADLSTFTGRTSGGVKFDVDGSASYEVGGTVYSAYQRNEVVLRGSFYRGGAVKDVKVVAGVPAKAAK